MDAPAMVALCVAIDRDVPAAVEEALRWEELARMQVADLQSYVAQHHFTENLQLPRLPGRPITWQTAYMWARSLLVDLRSGIMRALYALRMDRPDHAQEVVERMARETDEFRTFQAGGDTSSDEEMLEEEDMQM